MAQKYDHPNLPMRIFRKKPKRFLSPTAELFDSMIGEGMEIHGRIVAHNSIRIDGTVYGDVEIPEGKKNITVAVGAHGKVLGDIKAYRVLIGGQVEGNVYALERVELHGGSVPGAEVIGLLIKREGRKKEIAEASKLIKKIQDMNLKN